MSWSMNRITPQVTVIWLFEGPEEEIVYFMRRKASFFVILILLLSPFFSAVAFAQVQVRVRVMEASNVGSGFRFLFKGPA